jgi:NADPH-dependent stearoyl-CoA 9-desaturase
MRIDPQQGWHPVYLLQPAYNILLMLLFEWGVAVHDLDFTAIRAGEKSMKQVGKEFEGIAGKARTQIQKDYIAWPLISGLLATRVDAAYFALKVRRGGGRRNPSIRVQRMARRLRRRRATRGEVIMQLVAGRSFRQPFLRTLTANATANVIRNVWSYAIIFCGHFPDQTYTFTEDDIAEETRGGWYVRQLTGPPTSTAARCSM